MVLSKAVSVILFFGTLVIGVVSANVANGLGDGALMEPRSAGSPIDRVTAAPLRAEDLLGRWRGNWGYNRAPCTIEIDRIDGERFYGTLRKQGAVIAFEGTIDTGGRKVYFVETRVLTLGASMSEWSLGKNSGSFSPDGRTLTGVGRDKWGTYQWGASKY